MEIKQTNKLIGNYGEFLKYSDVFIETGSCMGRSIELALSAGFKKIKSVEAKEEYYEHCRRLFYDNPDVHLYLGKSIDHLGDMICDLTTPAIMFLDAHVSGEASAGYLDWVEKQGESDYDQDKVLKAEIKLIINAGFAIGQDHVFIIDDQNGSIFYADYIESLAPGRFKFELWDEQMGEIFYKNKMLIAIPI